MSDSSVHSTKIEQFTAHPIDHKKDKPTQASIPKGAELDSYLRGLLEWAYKEQDVRQFSFAQTSTQVCAALSRVIKTKKLAPEANIIAFRLLQKEKEAHKAVEHLKGVHEGMLLQALFKRDGVEGILLAKVDLSEFLGREDFRSRNGIDKKHRLLKFCLIEISNKLEIAAVNVGDTNATIAAYWWKDFLELSEKRTDSSNTKNAFAIFDTFLAKQLRQDHPRDYPILFNAVLGQFKRKQPFKFKPFLNAVFDGYQPISSSLDVAQLKQRANNLLDLNRFDANFTVLPEEVQKRFKKTYTLTPQIEVTVEGELANLAESISAHKLSDGTKGVFIKSDAGYEQFPPRPELQTATVTEPTNYTTYQGDSASQAVHVGQRD